MEKQNVFSCTSCRVNHASESHLVVVIWGPGEGFVTRVEFSGWNLEVRFLVVRSSCGQSSHSLNSQT